MTLRVTHTTFKGQFVHENRNGASWGIVAGFAVVTLLSSLSNYRQSNIRMADKVVTATYEAESHGAVQGRYITGTAIASLKNVASRLGPVEKYTIIETYADLWPVPCGVVLSVRRKGIWRSETCTVLYDRCVQIWISPQ